MQIDPTRKRILVAIIVGVIIGIIGAIVKFGWEIPFPPRTPLRDMTNPPQELLQQLGMSFDMSHLSYMYNENARPIMSFIIHFGFSIVFGVIYAVGAEYKPCIKMWQGTIFGFIVYVAFHVIIMPLMGTVPAPWDQPFAEHFSELFGHVFWLWVMELCRRDLRNRITHEPDVEVPLVNANR